MIAKVHSTQYQRSPIEGGFEIPLIVTTLEHGDSVIMEKMKQLLKENYDDNVTEVVVDSENECVVELQ